VSETIGLESQSGSNFDSTYRSSHITINGTIQRKNTVRIPTDPLGLFLHGVLY
jgi:hypothetical protein